MVKAPPACVIPKLPSGMLTRLKSVLLIRRTDASSAGPPRALSTVPDTRTVRAGDSEKVTLGCSSPRPSLIRCASAISGVPG